MDRDSFLGLVRVLTEQVIAAACPEKLADFADAFGDFILQAGALQVCDRLAYQPPPGSGLDTTLVAGMFFEVLLDAAQLPAGRRERVSFVRKRAKDYLVNRLAGQITLSQFYRLLNLIEEQVGHYFAHLTDDWTAPPRDREAAAPPRSRRPLTARPCAGPCLACPCLWKANASLLSKPCGTFFAVAVAAGSGC
jgi:hypothetical protein